jgi:hypothetical protein
MIGDDSLIKKRMIEALQEAWDVLPNDFLEILAVSMVERVAALLKAKGWHTKY